MAKKKIYACDKIKERATSNKGKELFCTKMKKVLNKSDCERCSDG